MGETCLINCILWGTEWFYSLIRVCLTMVFLPQFPHRLKAAKKSSWLSKNNGEMGGISRGEVFFAYGEGLRILLATRLALVHLSCLYFEFSSHILNYAKWQKGKCLCGAESCPHKELASLAHQCFQALVTLWVRNGKRNDEPDFQTGTHN